MSDQSPVPLYSETGESIGITGVSRVMARTNLGATVHKKRDLPLKSSAH